MKATCWMGPNKVSVRDVPDPVLLNDRDCIVKVTSTAICGSDLHLVDGYIPTTLPGDVLGHEFMGEVVDIGRGVTNLRVGQRVVVPFPIACGACVPCQRGLTSLCENSNPNAPIAEKLWGHSPCGIFGYSHATGGFAGGQAEYVRVPFADVGPLVIEDDAMPDEKVLFLTDVFPTGYMAADVCEIQPGDVVAVWGAGAVGLFAAASAQLLGAERVVVIDRFEYRLEKARQHLKAETINYEDVDVNEALREMTGGRGPDAAIDSVGMEAHHGTPAIYAYDRVKQAMRLETERPFALRQAITSVRNGGTVSVPGVYGGLLDKFPMGSVVNRALTIKSGQTHVHRYLRPLYERIQNGEIDPSFVISHRMQLADAPEGYSLFKKKKDDCTKVVLKP